MLKSYPTINNIDTPCNAISCCFLHAQEQHQQQHQLQLSAAENDIDNNNNNNNTSDDKQEGDDSQPTIATMAGDLLLTHEQHEFHLEGNIEELPPVLLQSTHDKQKLTGEFAYFYPYDGSEPSLLLIGKDFYINVTPQIS